MLEPTERRVHLRRLSDGMIGLTSALGTSLAEAAAVCLEDRQHQIGVTLQIRGLQEVAFCLEWIAATDQQRKTYRDMQEATEFGACAVAILMVWQLTGKVLLSRAYKGPGQGFDYWIGNPDAHDGDDNDLAGRARLEVSGILDGTTHQITARVNQKKKQISSSSNMGPGYVAVIEFSGPVAHIESV